MLYIANHHLVSKQTKRGDTVKDRNPNINKYNQINIGIEGENSNDINQMHTLRKMIEV